MRTRTTAVAVLGTGVMGGAMARRIAAAGLRTTVWNRRRAGAEPLAEAGARVADDPADAVRDADVVVTMVTDADAVLEIAGDRGMLAALPRDAVWAQMATIGVEGIEKVAALVAKERPDVTLVDAPVAGSRGPAEQGRLTVFAAGPDDVRERVAPVFDAVGQRTVWVGATGQASRVKLVNNLLLAYAAQGLAEALAVAGDLGLDRDTVLDAMDGSPLISGWQAQKLARIREDDYSPEYALTLGLKDVRLALAGAPVDRLSAATAILGQWQRAVDGGLGGEDVTVIVRALQ
ncbi:NAD(P)-dependent oxidoreductase [Couchioplanes caeruleus]|nr:NAD(P)-dependent oxidoreductase [Couchioplanes caeruleus]